MSNNIVKSQLLFLDTKHSSNPSTPSDSSFVLNFPVSNNMDGYSISVESVIFPNLVYPVNNTNNRIYYNPNGTSVRTATIPPGNYNAADFSAVIKEAMDQEVVPADGDLNFLVSYNGITSKLTITATSTGGGEVFELLSGTNDFSQIAGFNLNTGSASSHTGSNPIRLDGSTYVDIQTSIGVNNYSSNGKTNILCRIPLNVPYGAVASYENNTDDYLQLIESDIYNLEILLRDDQGAIFELPPNSQVSYVLKIVPVYSN